MEWLCHIPDMTDRAKIHIKRYFEEKGFKNANVEIVQREDITGDNRVLLDVNITKNEKIKVKKIFITGIAPKQTGKLKRAMKKTREKSFRNILRSKKFLPEKYEEDKGFLIDKLNAWGYRDALIRKDSVATVDDAHVNIYIVIPEYIYPDSETAYAVTAIGEMAFAYSAKYEFAYFQWLRRR